MNSSMNLIPVEFVPYISLALFWVGIVGALAILVALTIAIQRHGWIALLYSLLIGIPFASFCLLMCLEAHSRLSNSDEIMNLKLDAYAVALNGVRSLNEFYRNDKYHIKIKESKNQSAINVFRFSLGCDETFNQDNMVATYKIVSPSLHSNDTIILFEFNQEQPSTDDIQSYISTNSGINIPASSLHNLMEATLSKDIDGGCHLNIRVSDWYNPMELYMYAYAQFMPLKYDGQSHLSEISPDTPIGDSALYQYAFFGWQQIISAMDRLDSLSELKMNINMLPSLVDAERMPENSRRLRAIKPLYFQKIDSSKYRNKWNLVSDELAAKWITSYSAERAIFEKTYGKIK